MLQVPFIRKNQDLVIERLAKRNIDARQMVSEVISLDEERRNLQSKLDNTLAESNALSKEIGMLFKSGQVEKANEVKAKTSGLKEASKELTEQLNTTSNQLDELFNWVYSLPCDGSSSLSLGNSMALEEGQVR